MYGPAARVPGVEDAAQVLVSVARLRAEHGVGLVEQQRRRVVADRADQRGRADVDGQQRVVAGRLDDVEQSAFAAPLDRAGDVEPRRAVPCRGGVRGRGPQHDRVGGFRRGQHDVPRERLVQLVEQPRADRPGSHAAPAWRPKRSPGPRRRRTMRGRLVPSAALRARRCVGRRGRSAWRPRSTRGRARLPRGGGPRRRRRRSRVSSRAGTRRRGGPSTDRARRSARAARRALRRATPDHAGMGQTVPRQRRAGLRYCLYLCAVMSRVMGQCLCLARQAPFSRRWTWLRAGAGPSDRPRSFEPGGLAQPSRGYAPALAGTDSGYLAACERAADRSHVSAEHDGDLGHVGEELALRSARTWRTVAARGHAGTCSPECAASHAAVVIASRRLAETPRARASVTIV